MLNGKPRIPVEKALLDLLREYGTTLDDLLVAMKTENLDVYEELIKRIAMPSKDTIAYIYSLPWKLVALTLFTLQALYIVNPSGLYKGYLLDPPREQVIITNNKASHKSILVLITRLKNLI